MGTFDNFLSKAKNVANVAGKKTGEMVEISKIKLQLIQLNGDVEKVYQRIGQLVYQQHSVGVENGTVIEAAISEIDGLLAQIAEVNAKLTVANEQIVCENCGCINSADSVFCSRCGVTNSYEMKPKEAAKPDGYVEVSYDEK